MIGVIDLAVVIVVIPRNNIIRLSHLYIHSSLLLLLLIFLIIPLSQPPPIIERNPLTSLFKFLLLFRLFLCHS